MGTIHFALQNYTKKMTLANKSAISMNFCIFLFFYITAFYAVGASVLFYAFNICLLSTFSNTAMASSVRVASEKYLVSR